MPTNDDPRSQPACRERPSQQLLAEYQQLQEQLNDPGVHADQNRARRLGRRYAELTPIVTTSGAA